MLLGGAQGLAYTPSMDDEEVARLVEAHLDWAHSIAAGYAATIRHVDVQDLKQEAALALTLAAQTFDPTYNVPFQAYARRCITNRLDSLYRAGQQRHAYDYIGADEAPADEQDDFLNAELPSPDVDPSVEAHRNEIRQALQTGASKLTPNQRDILTSFARGDSYQEIADRLGSSRQAVQQAATRALAQMRGSLEIRGHTGPMYSPRHESDLHSPHPASSSSGCVGCLLIVIAMQILIIVVAVLWNR